MTIKKLSKQLVSESIIYGLASVFSKFIAIFVVPVYTRVFSPDQYGKLSVINTTYQLLATISMLCLDTASSRWCWDTDNDDYRKSVMSTWFFTQMTFSIILALLLLISSRALSIIFFQNPDEASSFIICAFALPLATFSVVLSKFYRFSRKPYSSVSFSVLTTLVNVTAVIFLVLAFKVGIVGYFWAALITKAVGAIWASYILRDRIKLSRFSMALLSDLFRYAIPILPTIIGSWLINQVSVYFLTFMKGTSETGLYQVGITVASLGALVSSAFQQAWGPFAFSIEKQENARKFYGFAFLLYTCIGGFIAFVNGLFSKELLNIFTSEKFVASWSIVSVLSFAFISQGFISIAALGCNISKKNNAIGIGVMIGALVSIVSNLVLTPLFGKEGSAVSFLISQIIYSAYIFRKAQAIYYIPYKFRLGYLVFSGLFLCSFLGSISDSILIKLFLLIIVIIIFTLLIKIKKNDILLLISK